MRVLIVKTSSLGDIVHALPVATDIARALPGVAVDWVAEAPFAALPALHPAVARVVPVALRRWRRAPFAAATRAEVRAAWQALRAERYAAVIDCQGLLKSALVARCARGPASGLDRTSAREPLAAWAYARRIAVPRTLHAIERNRRIAAAALGYRLDGPARFAWRPAAAAPLDGTPAVLLIHASRPTKRWPDADWLAVGGALAARGLPVLLPWGSAAEGERSRALAARLPGAIVPPLLPLDRLAAQLALAPVVVGLDTGLTHLAGALGRPTVAVFCDYDPALAGVTGAAARNVGDRAGPPPRAAVLAAVEAVLAAPPPAEQG